MIGISPVERTMGSEEIGFGGSYGSTNHTEGNNSDPCILLYQLPRKKL